MRSRNWLSPFILALGSFMVINFSQAQYLQAPVNILTTKDGLPQSFISAMVQDSTGFVWIGTRDGLARYDGKKFKIFQHVSGDNATLSNNTIIGLYLDKQNRLWIQYETGHIDVLNATTEALFHLTRHPVYKALYASAGVGHNMREDGKGNAWLVVEDGVFVCNIDKLTCRFYPEASLGLQKNKLVGITSCNDEILFVTDTALVTVNGKMKFTQITPYTFAHPHLYDRDAKWRDTYTIANSNKILIHDKHRLILYDSHTRSFTDIPLPDVKDKLYFHLTQDNKGQVFFNYDSVIYKLSPEGEISVLKTKEGAPAFGFMSLLVDRSGVLWLGGNGSGIHLFDMRLSRMAGKSYAKNFSEDILLNYLKVPVAELRQSFLKDMQPYEFRWIEGGDGKIWLSKAVLLASAQPPVCYYKNGHITRPGWQYADTSASRHNHINAMGISRSGKLWGMDFYSRPVHFDTLTRVVTVYPPALKNITLSNNFTVNSLLIDDEDTFWITTAMDGLFQFDRKQNRTIRYFYREIPGALPSNQLMNLVRDPFDSNILWIASLGGGLIRFNKTTGKSIAFTTKDGLPNNTVYAIVADNSGAFWCSSNKGIFIFDPKKGFIRSFTSKDGLAGDEFNRYHFFKFPDGRIAFGGVDGYTVFNPKEIATDNFQPQVALTGIRINNVPADFGFDNSPFKSAINSLSEIKLDHTQNFLAFEFAALEYNIPEKNQYRYMLQGFDEKWVLPGNDNIATYTKLPPGDYIFRVNASNTTGQWSLKIREIAVLIRPPFWQTWWAYCLYVLCIAGLIWVYIQYRVNRERMRQEVLLKEKEAMQLKTVDELKTRFFSNITHEFRTPLTLILAPVQRLQLALQKKDHLRWLGAIERNANQLLRLINQLLDFAKLESGTIKVHETKANLCDTIGGFLESFYEEAEVRGTHLTFSCLSDATDYWFDADKLEQVIRNLVSNALKFTGKAGKVEVICSRENPDQANKDNYAAENSDTALAGIFLTVRDTGTGIPADQLPYIFNRFYQVPDIPDESSPASHLKGSGIGLALVKELVELQGGTIGVESFSETSTSWRTIFTIWMPYRQAIAAKEAPGAQPTPGNTWRMAAFEDKALPASGIKNEGTKEATILIAEDNDELAGIIADSLCESYHVIRTANGAQALEQAFEVMPELVISDVLMPVADGFELCGRLKNDDRTNHIPVILLTAKAGFDNRIQGLTLGADDYITKPFHIKELQLRVHNLLERQRRMREKMGKELSRPEAEMQPLPRQADLQHAFIQRLYDKVEEKLDDSSFGVNELASAIGMSRATLHRKLKAISDLSAGEIIRNYRLKRATQFLKEGFNSSETAYSVGFESPAYFSKCFREFYSITPLEFIQKES